MKTTATLITDDQSLLSAKGRFGRNIPVYDDGFGPLFIHRDSMGISGIVRAQSWEDAYSICEDEFFPEADETVEELQKEYGFTREHVKIIRVNGIERPAVFPSDYPNGRLANGAEFVRWKTVETPEPDAWTDNELFQEAYGFRPNGPNAKDVQKHGIYAKDLNGDSLEKLTPQMLRDWEITLEITDNE